MATSLSHNTSSSYHKNTLEGAESDSVGSSLSSTVGSSSNLLESVHEQELQFSKLAKEIEEEKRLVKQQLDMDQRSYSGGSDGYHPDVYVTHTEEYGDPEEETSVLIDEDGNEKTVKTRTVTKTVTEKRVHHQHIPNHMSPNGGGDHPSNGMTDRDSLLRRNSSSTASGSSYADNRTPVPEVSYDATDGSMPPSVRDFPREEVVRTPEKFHAEEYGLEEDDAGSDYGGEDNDYGLDANEKPASVTSDESGEKYSSDSSEEANDLPIAAPRGSAPLAQVESGSRATLDGLGGWKTPTLEEVIRMLSYNVPVVQLNAAAYVQHLTFNNESLKKQVKDLRGIPPLVRLLDHPDEQIQLHACGALRNISYGEDANKIAIKKCEGVPAICRLVRSSENNSIREQATGTLWNLSAHPDLKGQLLELGLEPLVNLVIIPYAESISASGKTQHIDMLDLFTNGCGVIRNLSSTASSECRKRLRECPELVRSLMNVVQANTKTGMVLNKSTENSVCVLRNLTFKLQNETDNWHDLYMLEAAQQEPQQESGFLCFNKSKPKTVQPDYGEQLPENDALAEGAAVLWQPEASQAYCKLLADCQGSPDITEATLGAILNLTCGVWKWAVFSRAIIRKEKGLPDIIDRMRTDNDRIVRNVAISLTNLSQDLKNKDLIGKFAMKDLVYKLPGGTEGGSGVRHSDPTVIAVLNTIRVLVDKSADNVKYLRESAGIERITTINKKDNSPYQARVVKAAGQVLQAVWANKSTHSMLKKDGWNKNHFVPTVTMETLPRRQPGGGIASPAHSTYGGGNTIGRRGEMPPGYSTLPPAKSTKNNGTHADSWV